MLNMPKNLMFPNNIKDSYFDFANIIYTTLSRRLQFLIYLSYK